MSRNTDDTASALSVIAELEAQAVGDPARFFSMHPELGPTETPHVTIVQHYAKRRAEVLHHVTPTILDELRERGVITEDEGAR